MMRSVGQDNYMKYFLIVIYYLQITYFGAMLNDISRCQKYEKASTEAEENYPTHIPRLLFGGANGGLPLRRQKEDWHPIFVC